MKQFWQGGDRPNREEKITGKQYFWRDKKEKNGYRLQQNLLDDHARILDKNNISMENDFIYATLTNEDIVNDAIGIFREYYPNTVKIDYDNSHTKEIENVDITRITQNKTFDELIRDFYMQMYSCDMGEEELEIMKWAAKEAGVGNEAD